MIMQAEKIKKLRDEICAGSQKHRKKFLKQLEPLIKSIVGSLNSESSLRKRREKMIKQISLDVLYSGICPDNISFKKYLKGLFTEVFYPYESNNEKQEKN